MNRDFKAEILILKSWDFKERHRKLQVISPQLGMVQLVQFGGQSTKKGRRQAAEVFCYGVAQLQRDPRFDSWQLKDFEMIHGFQENRQDLRKFYLQTLMAESILSSHGGGGESQEAFQLLMDYFSLLEKTSDPLELDRLTLRYILEFLSLLGLEHFYRRCGHCGHPLESMEPLFIDREGRHSCPECARQGMEALPPGVRPFLDQLQRVPREEINRIGMTPALIPVLKNWMLSALERQLGRRLKTLKSGRGIL